MTAAAARASVRTAVRAAAARLAAAGVASPEHDAEALAAVAAGVPRGRLPLLGRLDDAATARYDALVARRAAREPLQHLTGSVGFRYLDLIVGPGVFVPRPETELVAGAAVDAARAAGPGVVVVDLCAGSGAIGLAVAHEVPGAVVHAVEREPAAYDWLRRNIAGTGLPVTAHLADVATACTDLDGGVAVVAANPPYVPDDEMPRVEPEVRRDPDAALWGGPDGLDTIRTVVAAAARLLRPDGVLVMEHSDRHAGSVPALLRAGGGWTDVADHDDLAGRPRYVTARRSAPPVRRAETGRTT